MTTLASDNFNRANQNPLGSNWSTGGGTFGTLQLLSNAVQGVTAATTSAAYYNAVTWPNDQWSECTLTNLGADSDSGVACRISASAETAYVFNCPVSGGVYNLYRAVAGTYTLIASGAGSVALNDVIRIEAQGTTIRALKNGAIVLSVVDANIASGNAGLFAYDNDVALDNWNGGDFPSGPSPGEAAPANSPRPGRGPYSKGVYKRARIDAFATPLIVASPGESEIGSRRPRPGRGPYSKGVYKRGRVDAFAGVPIVVVVNPGAAAPANSPRPGRGPYSKGVYKRARIDAYADVPIVVTPPVGPSDGEYPRNRNRPGRGPYSLGLYFRERIDAYTSAQAVQSFTITPTGGLQFGGVTVAFRGVVFSPTGGLQFGGTAPFAKGYTIAPTGGLQFGGVTAPPRSRVVIPTGGLNFGGAAAVQTHEASRIVTPSGGIIFGGSSPVSFFSVGSGNGDGAPFFVQRFRKRPHRR